MSTTIANTSRETISRLIRMEFDSIEWYNQEAKENLINTAKSYELNELVEEMENDLNL